MPDLSDIVRDSSDIRKAEFEVKHCADPLADIEINSDDCPSSDEDSILDQKIKAYKANHICANTDQRDGQRDTRGFYVP